MNHPLLNFQARFTTGKKNELCPFCNVKYFLSRVFFVYRIADIRTFCLQQTLFSPEVTVRMHTLHAFELNADINIRL